MRATSLNTMISQMFRPLSGSGTREWQMEEGRERVREKKIQPFNSLWIFKWSEYECLWQVCIRWYSLVNVAYHQLGAIRKSSNSSSFTFICIQDHLLLFTTSSARKYSGIREHTKTKTKTVAKRSTRVRFVMFRIRFISSTLLLLLLLVFSPLLRM